MKNNDHHDYQRIAQAIEFIQTNFKTQPSLEAIAEQVHLSPYHFQRLFTTWAGTSPKKFVQYLSLDYAKKVLKTQQATLANTAYQTGLSGSSRLHDLFITLEGMSPATYKHGGKNLSINYSFATSPFGNILLAATPKGLCHLAFYEDPETALEVLKSSYPKATFQAQEDAIQQAALQIFATQHSNLPQIKLHLKGSPFQLKVWEALLKIPQGQLSTYGTIAQQIQRPKASRAVGTAIGNNPIAFLIPCHRVIRSTGQLSAYRWGSTRKQALIAWEAAQLQQND